MRITLEQTLLDYKKDCDCKQKLYRTANENVETYLLEREKADGEKLTTQNFNIPAASSTGINLPTSNQQPYNRPGTSTKTDNLACDALVRLHSRLQSCPIKCGTSDPGPQGLKVPLLPHQKKAMSWLLWREQQHPNGGILADDAGLGKTLTMIALILRSKELHGNTEESQSSTRGDMKQGGTLVICPLSVLKQWEDEIKHTCERSPPPTLVYHGKF